MVYDEDNLLNMAYCCKQRIGFVFQCLFAFIFLDLNYRHYFVIFVDCGEILICDLQMTQ